MYVKGQLTSLSEQSLKVYSSINHSSILNSAYGQLGGLSALSGMRGLGSMGMGLALGAGGGEISTMEYMLLDSAVKQIVGPKASPTPTMLMLTSQQGNQPVTMVQMLAYVNELQSLARQHNVKPPGVVGTPTRQQERHSFILILLPH